MTAEVSIMNSYSIALAADSAVTIGSNKRIFYTLTRYLCFQNSIQLA